MIGKIISLVIALIYLVLIYFFTDNFYFSRTVGSAPIALACIWFGDALGRLTGIFAGGHFVDGETPGCVVAFLGWSLLFLPAIVFVFTI